MKNRKLICKICQFSCGKRDKFESHLRNVHNYESLEEAWKDQNGKNNLCGCGCGGETSFISWNDGFSRFINGHNGNVYSAYDTDTAQQIVEKRAKKLLGRSSWSAGRKKNECPSLAAAADAISRSRKEKIKNGAIAIWSKGLSKNTSDKLNEISIKIKNDFSTGSRTSWSTGKTERDDDRVAKRNETLRRRYAAGEITVWHKGTTADEDPRLKKKCESGRDNTFALKFRLNKDEILARLSDLKNLILLDRELTNYRNSNLHTLMFKCVKCGNVSYESLQTATTDNCRLCNPYASKAQLEIHDWIVRQGFEDAFINNRVSIKPYELDVYVPSKAFAIEFNGLYYHNSKMITNDLYHEQKLMKAWANGIKLLHIFEDEWSDKKEIVKSIISQKLGITQHRIGARNCSVRKMNVEERRTFFSENHLEGDVNSTIAFCLVHSGEIVAAISLRKPFHKRRFIDTIEVGRFSTKLNISVAGGLSKLLSAAVEWCKDNGYRKILTYVDKRIGDGAAYETAGMKYCYDTEPRFWWTDNHKRYNRFKFKAFRGKSEKDVAEAAGVTRIYGCKNKVYSLQVN